MGKYQSAKYTSCFRQFGAEGTHCRFIHAYKIRFECEFNKDIKYLKVNYPEFIDYLDRWFQHNFNYKNLLGSILKNYVGQYSEYIKLSGAKNLIITGGIPTKLPIIVDLFKNSYPDYNIKHNKTKTPNTHLGMVEYIKEYL